MADWPPSLKPIGKYIVRAREVQATRPLVAYYCNYYALKRAIELRDSSDEKANRLVTGLLEKCEAAKAAIGVDDGSHRGIVEEFALSVFDRADTEDREDRASKETAQTFYAAVCFFEVCSVFAPLTSDLDQRLRYAKWKAIDISKALKAGRRPLPGAPGEAEALEEQRRAAEAEQAAAQQADTEQASASAPPADTADAAGSRQETGAAYPQESQQVGPAPPVREYDSDLLEYQPQPMSKGRPEGAGPYPSVAPPYPSADISPLPQHEQYPPSAHNEPAYPSMKSAYPTTDSAYAAHNSAYPATSGYPTPSAPYIPPSAPYATEDASRAEPSKGPLMPPIPSLDIPGLGTNMGDPPAGQQRYPPRSDPVHAPRQSDPVHPPPRSDPAYAEPRSDPAYAEPRSDPAYTAPRPEPVHEPPQGQSLYAQPRSDPVYAPPRSDPTYPPSSQDFAGRLPGALPPQAPMQAALPAPAPVKTGGAVSTYKPSIKDTQEAQRLAKYAASALDFQDLKTAVANLEDALNLLKGRQ